MSGSDQPHFAKMYAEGTTPWDTGKPCPELLAALNAGELPGKTVLDIGCGHGSNAMEFARRGYDVTGVDYVPQALNRAIERAEKVGMLGNVLRFHVADMTENPEIGGPFDVLYDRGAYHSIRRVNLEGFLDTLKKVSKPGTRWLNLSGNSKESLEYGPPTVSEEDVRKELGGLFKILSVKEITIETCEPKFRPLGWVFLMERK